GRLKTSPLLKGPKAARFSPKALKAFLAAAGLRSANAQRSQLSATLDSAAGFLSRIKSITSRNGRVSAFESNSTNACIDFVTGSFGSKVNIRSNVDFSIA